MSSKYTVSLEKIANEFSLKVLNAPAPLSEIMISSNEINRPGLQMAGYYEFFDERRIQIIGKSEESFIERFTPEKAEQRIRDFFGKKPSAVVVCRDLSFGEQYIEIADNFIAYQNEDGGWPKNIDWLAKLPTDSVKAALKESYRRSTMDNRNTFPQIEYLGDVYVLTREDKYRQAALKGLNYLLKMQNKSGGWRGWDVDAITFNDEVTTGALELFLKINRGDNSFKWLDDSMKKRIYEAFNHGLDVILKCQYIQNGVKTAF